MGITRINFLKLTIAVALLAPLPAAGAEWKPSGTMHAVVASGVGGAYDVLMRAMSKHWEKHFGVKLIVQNVKGAGGSLGLDRVVKSKADGQTIGFMSRSPYLGELIKNNFPWKVQDIPIILAAKTPPYVISVSAKSPFRKWDEVRKLDRMVRLGVASQLSTELVIIKDLVEHGRKVTTGNMKTTELITAMLAGDLDLWVSVASATLMDPVKAGNVRPLVTLDTRRYEKLPDVPALAEVNMPPHWKDVGAIRMWFAPIGTPPDIVAAIGTRMKALLSDPAIAGWAKKTGFVHEVISGAEAKASQEGLVKIIKDNMDLYKKYGG